jgi:hypothetical protein
MANGAGAHLRSLADQQIANEKANIEQQIAAEHERRTLEHQAKIKRFKLSKRNLEADALAAIVNPVTCLAMGDSWFDYPLNDYGIISSNQDILAQLQNIGNPPPVILSHAVHGQSMAATMGLSNQGTYVSDLADENNWINGKPDAILISGGGDDIAGDPLIIYLDYAGRGLSSRVQGVLASIEASYQALFQFRDVYIDPKTPIIGHCYDYAIPDGRGVFLLSGPWLKPSFDFAGYQNVATNQQTIKSVIDDLYAMFDGLQKDKNNNFILIDTRGTLTADATQPLGWANELHPYTAGFLALAQEFLKVLKKEFPGRV